MKGKNLFISVLMLTLLLAIPFAYAVDDYCTYCGEKEYTFTKTGLDLGTTNTLKIVGHDTHGVTYISINCEIEDTGPPVTNITPDGSSWGNSNVAFALDCQDDSGCQATYYKVINDGESCGATGFSAGTSGTVTCGSGQVCRKRICYYSKDTAGNTEDTRKSGVFEIDREIPFTSISLSGTLGGDNWYTSNVDVTLACSDAGSGCSVTEYCIDTTNTCLPSNTYSSAFTVSGNGKNYVRYRSVDSTGNQEGIKTREIKIDKVKPATQIIPDGRPWTNTDVAFSLTCIDTHSLCQITYFKVTDYDDPCGSSGYVTGNTGSVPCSSGETCRKKVCYYSKDNAGNTESVKESGTFEIDRQTPTVTVTGNPAEWQNADVDAYVDCYDGGSGCNTDSFMIKVYASQPANCPHNYNEYDHMSPHTISSHSWVCGAAKDNVENTGFSSPIEFKVDKNPPTPSILDPAISVTKDSVTLQWNHNNDEDFESYEVHYSESQGFTPTDYTLIKRIADKGTTTYMIEGLEEETTYYFKIVTADVTGLTSVSNEISETTHFCDVGETKSCGSNIGECSNGTSTCDDNGKWGPCIGYIGPANETCNGKDDDCDGVIDNVDGKNSIEATKCACYGETYTAGELSETCNWIDDDCNEQVDDGINCGCMEGQKKSCGSDIGECASGERKCVNGEWGECVGSVGPETEICNGKDDNCDGTVDNVYGGNSPESAKCACYGGFSQRGAEAETCNGIDDNCDGRIDEGCPGGGYAAGPNCNNGIQDGDEEGVDCGGSCLPCPTAPEIPEWSWLVVFLIFVVVIAVVGVALVFFEKK